MMLALRALSELAFPSAGHNKVIFSLLLSYGADTEASGLAYDSKARPRSSRARQGTFAFLSCEVVAMVAVLEVFKFTQLRQLLIHCFTVALEEGTDAGNHRSSLVISQI